MRTGRNIGAAAILAALAVVSACGHQAKQQASSVRPSAAKTKVFTGDPEGAYCRLTIKREAAQLRQDLHPFKPESPELVQSELDYIEFLKQGELVTPPALRTPFHTFAAWKLDTFYPTVRKYGYDEGRFGREATAEDKKVVQEPANVEKAFGEVIRFESQVCNIGDPIAPDVKFNGSSKSAYCVEVQKDQAADDTWWNSDPGTRSIRTFFTSHIASLEMEDRAAAADTSVPSAVRAGIHKWVENVKTDGLAVLTKYDYNIARLIEEATTAERRAFTGTGPDLRDARGVSSAYNDQVCSKK